MVVELEDPFVLAHATLPALAEKSQALVTVEAESLYLNK
jgi:hypothetical protein